MNKTSHRIETIAFLAAERGIAAEKIRASDRLLHDLGMDGDDAVEFFEGIEQRFGTDLTHLYARWGEHFGPEQGPISMPVLVGGAVVALIAGVFGLPPFWSVIAIVAALAVCILVLKRLPGARRLIPITVEDVVLAVDAGAWPAAR